MRRAVGRGMKHTRTVKTRTVWLANPVTGKSACFQMAGGFRVTQYDVSGKRSARFRKPAYKFNLLVKNYQSSGHEIVSDVRGKLTNEDR